MSGAAINHDDTLFVVFMRTGEGRRYYPQPGHKHDVEQFEKLPLDRDAMGPLLQDANYITITTANSTYFINPDKLIGYRPSQTPGRVTLYWLGASRSTFVDVACDEFEKQNAESGNRMRRYTGNGSVERPKVLEN